MDRLKNLLDDLESERSTSTRTVAQSGSGTTGRQGSGRSLGNLVASAGENLKQEEEDAGRMIDDDNEDTKQEATVNKVEQQQGSEASPRLPPQTRRLDAEPSFNFLDIISARRIAATSAAAAASKVEGAADREDSDAHPHKPESRRRTTVTKLPSSQSVFQGSSSTGTSHHHSSLLSVGDRLLNAFELSNLESETVSPSDANVGIPASLRSRFIRRGSYSDVKQPSRSSAVQQLACIEPRRRRGSEVGDEVIYRRRSSDDLGRKRSSKSSSESSKSSSTAGGEGEEGRKDARGGSKHSLAYSHSFNGSGDSSSSHGRRGVGRGLLDDDIDHDSFSTLASIERQVAKRSHFRRTM